MFVNYDGRIARDITGDFFLSLFVDEASKAANIYIVSSSHVALYNIEKGFYGCGNIRFVDTGFVSNLIDYVSFCHRNWFLISRFFGSANLGAVRSNPKLIY